VKTRPQLGDCQVLEQWFWSELVPLAGQVLQSYPRRKMPEMSLDWSLRGRTAGQVRFSPGKAQIRLNLKLLDFPANGFHELYDTLAHELAHVVASVISPRSKPHGPVWQEIAVFFGAVPKASHQLPLAAVRRSREYRYQIGDDNEIWLGQLRHRRLQSGRSQYIDRLSGHLIHAQAFCGQWRWKGTELVMDL